MATILWDDGHTRGAKFMNHIRLNINSEEAGVGQRGRGDVQGVGGDSWPCSQLNGNLSRKSKPKI